MSPVRHQAFIWTNAALLSIGLLGTNFSEIQIWILLFSFKKIHLKCCLSKWGPFCPVGDEVTNFFNVLNGDFTTVWSPQRHPPPPTHTHGGGGGWVGGSPSTGRLRFGWSSIWHSSNTGSPSQQSEQTSILLGSGHFVWPSFLFWIHRIWWGCG